VEGGTAPYTYSWDNGATTQDLSEVPAGDYICTITDSKDCEFVSDTFTVGEPEILEITSSEVTNADCNGAPTGAIDIEVAGGTTPYTYEWSNGETTQDLNEVEAGTYEVTVYDLRGCMVASSEIEIGEPDAIEITSMDISHVLCNGEANGAIDIEAEGGTGDLTYLWSNDETTQDIDELEAGEYTVVITDENGCTLTATATVDEPAELMEEFPPAVEHVSCNGEADGSITLAMQGGTLPYDYLWSNGGTDSTITELEAGTYSYTVTDGNGCIFESGDIEVTEPDALAVEEDQENVACIDESTGVASVSVSGGTEPYDYLWTNGATTSSIGELAAGDYTCVVTDANDCSITSETIVITQPSSALTATVEVTDETANGAGDGTATVVASGGGGSYEYEWQDGFGDDQTIDELLSGIYCVDVTDANGCKFTACGTVGYPTAIADVFEISEITLYPNPTNSFTSLNISLTKAADINLAVVDVLGKEYQNQLIPNVSEASVTFDLSDFAAGTYFIRIDVDQESLALPVIVQH